MNKNIYDTYTNILKIELISALGCTEPIAIAFAGAKAREVLGVMPNSIAIKCSGNIIKNVKGVIVPNSGGLKGIDVAVTLGVVAGNAKKNLEVLSDVREEDIEITKNLINNNFCKCELIEGEENLQIIVDAIYENNSATVEIKSSHTHISKIIKNGKLIFIDENVNISPEDINRDLLNIKDIYEYANIVNIDDIKNIIDNQINLNYQIAKEGILNDYGAKVGKTILNSYDSSDVRVRAKAMAAAGSDARMGGALMPVVINSGSGNQGITVSVPVIEYAKELNVSHEKLLRALVLSNLVAILQKKYIGKLSAFCGAVSAGTAAAAGISFLYGGTFEDISNTITNAIANIGGIICDGAKSSCAAKIASSVEGGILGFILSNNIGQAFKYGEGIVQDNVDNTIRSIGKIAKEGMKSTDMEILNIMIGK
mgnify:FL=1